MADAHDADQRVVQNQRQDRGRLNIGRNPAQVGGLDSLGGGVANHDGRECRRVPETLQQRVAGYGRPGKRSGVWILDK
jgi:hypothetical protein